MKQQLEKLNTQLVTSLVIWFLRFQTPSLTSKLLWTSEELSHADQEEKESQKLVGGNEMLLAANRTQLDQRAKCCVVF